MRKLSFLCQTTQTNLQTLQTLSSLSKTELWRPRWLKADLFSTMIFGNQHCSYLTDLRHNCSVSSIQQTVSFMCFVLEINFKKLVSPFRNGSGNSSCILMRHTCDVLLFSRLSCFAILAVSESLISRRLPGP